MLNNNFCIPISQVIQFGLTSNLPNIFVQHNHLAIDGDENWTQTELLKNCLLLKIKILQGIEFYNYFPFFPSLFLRVGILINKHLNFLKFDPAVVKINYKFLEISIFKRVCRRPLQLAVHWVFHCQRHSSLGQKFASLGAQWFRDE